MKIAVLVLAMMLVPSRGVRNNNPGCIRSTTWTTWLGEREKQTDPILVQFKSAHYGLRAMSRVLGNYQVRHGLTTPKEIVTRWCGGESAKNYVAYVYRANKWGAQKKLDLKDESTMLCLMESMIRWENGLVHKRFPYESRAMKAAVRAAWPKWYSTKERDNVQRKETGVSGVDFGNTSLCRSSVRQLGLHNDSEHQDPQAGVGDGQGQSSHQLRRREVQD